MRSTREPHTIFKYRGQEKRDRRSSVKFSSEPSTLSSSTNDESQGKKQRGRISLPKGTYLFPTRSAARIAHKMSHPLFVTHVLTKLRVACWLLASESNSTGLCVEQTNQHEVYRMCVCVFVPIPKKKTRFLHGAPARFDPSNPLLEIEQTKRGKIILVPRAK